MSAQTRDRILEAACEVIADEGIDDLRIARVAMRAGASTSPVHHYFWTREELLEQALMHSYELAAEDRFGNPADPDASASERFRVMIDECLPLPGRQRNEWALWVELWLRATRDPSSERAANAAPFASLVAELLLPLHALHAILEPTIRWRTRHYRVCARGQFREVER